MPRSVHHRPSAFRIKQARSSDAAAAVPESAGTAMSSRLHGAQFLSAAVLGRPGRGRHASGDLRRLFWSTGGPDGERQGGSLMRSRFVKRD